MTDKNENRKGLASGKKEDPAQASGKKDAQSQDFGQKARDTDEKNINEHDFDEINADLQQGEETYGGYLKDVKKAYDRQPALSESEQKKIVKVGRNTARNTTIMVSLAILLLIVPVMTLLSYGYYAAGSKANTLIDVVGKTIYVPEPNMSLEEMELESDIGFFTMELAFDVFKRVGREDYRVGDYEVYFALDEPGYPEKNLYQERSLPEWSWEKPALLVHPDGFLEFQTKREWEILNHLPDGTVAEAYISLSELMDPDELPRMLPANVEVRWLAVDTGFEAEQADKEGTPLEPIGYPAQIDTTVWSPFNGREQTNAEVFVDTLKLLKEHEGVAERVANTSLEIAQRLKYLDKNGISVYGAVVTGPAPELRKLEQMEEIRAIKVGEVKLWNWE